MNKFIYGPLLGVGLFIAGTAQTQAQTDDINRFYLGAKVGTVGSIKISESGNTAEIGNSGLGGSYIFGYKLNPRWSVEAGFTSIEDFGFGSFVSGNHIDLHGKYLQVNYTHFYNPHQSYLRLKGGAISWEVEAEESAMLFFFDITPEDHVGPYTNTGISPIVSAEWGREFNKWIEWSWLGAESVFSGDAQWNTIYTSLKFSF